MAQTVKNEFPFAMFQTQPVPDDSEMQLVNNVKSKERSGCYMVLKNEPLRILRQYDLRLAAKWFPFINPRISAPPGTDLRVWAVPRGNYQVSDGRPTAEAEEGGFNSFMQSSDSKKDEFDTANAMLLANRYERLVTNGHGAYAALPISEAIEACKRLVRERNPDLVATSHGFLQLCDSKASVSLYYTGTENEFMDMLHKHDKPDVDHDAVDEDGLDDAIAMAIDEEAKAVAVDPERIEERKEMAEISKEIDGAVADSESDEEEITVNAALPTVLELLGVRVDKCKVVPPPGSSRTLARLLDGLYIKPKCEQQTMDQMMRKMSSSKVKRPHHVVQQEDEDDKRQKDASVVKKRGKNLAVLFNDTSCIYVSCQFARTT